MSKPIVEIENLSVALSGNLVLHDVCLTIYERDFLGIIGPNGGGKTTLAKALLGLIKPASGTIRFFDENLKSRIGYMPQNNQIDKKFPILVSEAVDSGLIRNKNLSRKERRETVDNILNEMGIANIAGKAVGELSGGQLQRVLLARALVGKPELLILDEPNSYVDKAFEAYFYDNLKKINETAAIILISHDTGSIVSSVKNIACVNETLHYHSGSDVSGDWLEEHLGCPLDIISHGDLPHRILKKH